MPPPEIPLHPTLARVTARIRERSAGTRAGYLQQMEQARAAGSQRSRVSCTNLAHAFAAAEDDKPALRAMRWPSLAIVSSYNDMLSAHQPLQKYPELLKSGARRAGAVAQFAGGVPAMCDGVTQGQPGMELSLFSRDVIAMATAVALSHNTFDGVLCLGVCDKIVPGLLIGALQFGHLPCVFVPGGPMTSGLPNKEKARIRQLHAEHRIGEEELLDAEMKSYHGPGTCTFFGTANSNQMLMEIMGLHLPGSAFVNPNTPLRTALTEAAAHRCAQITALGDQVISLADIVDERTIVNAIVGLLATGGSTNHTIHLIAIARAAGLLIDWSDFDELSGKIPLLARIYPNGSADVNHFHAAGGMGFLIRELLQAGLLHADVNTIMGPGLDRYTLEPHWEHDSLSWIEAPKESRDVDVLRGCAAPFSGEGGIRLLRGNLGRAVIKTSAVKVEHQSVTAPARVFDSQDAMLAAFERDEFKSDVVAVVRYQGPRANGMPELHKLTPALGVLQDRGLNVALVTDGRMSGASGKVPAAIHVTPECLNGGLLARVRDGDLVRVDAVNGALEVLVDQTELLAREVVIPDLRGNAHGVGRDLFASMRSAASGAEQGAATFGWQAAAEVAA
ncbi:MAG: phosphogluconate dehydratase [Pseudomonadota bacterium]|nr:phosphogluconate dehydratase [Pseudomonadota bacterium]